MIRATSDGRADHPDRRAGVNYPLAWSAGGEQIIFSSTRNGNAEIHHDRRRRDEIRLTDDPAGRRPGRPHAVAAWHDHLRAVVHGDPPAGLAVRRRLGRSPCRPRGRMTFNDQTAGSYWSPRRPCLVSRERRLAPADCRRGQRGAEPDPAQTVTYVCAADGRRRTVIYTLAPVVIR